MIEATYSINPIGAVQATEGMFCVKLDEAHRASLLGLTEFSHVIIFWWAHQTDNDHDRAIQTEKLYYADNIEAGVFACRSPRRPNPIAMTVCTILDVNPSEGTIAVPNIDAEPGTPVIDLKPYIGMTDRVKTLKPASWFADWPQWIPEEAADVPDWVMAKLMAEPED